MSDRVITTIEDGVAEVRLNRADKMNALDSASAEGRGFCAGLDFSSFQAMADDDKGAERPTFACRCSKSGGDSRLT